MNIALVGSRQMTITEPILGTIAGALAALDYGDTLLVRSPNGQHPTSAFEAIAVHLAHKRQLNVEYFSPRDPGRAANFKRDYELVLAADEVLAYFPKGFDLDGGTWHVIHAAMQKGIPCRAFTITQDGRAELIGSEDGEAPFIDDDEL